MRSGIAASILRLTISHRRLASGRRGNIIDALMRRGFPSIRRTDRGGDDRGPDRRTSRMIGAHLLDHSSRRDGLHLGPQPGGHRPAPEHRRGLAHRAVPHPPRPARRISGGDGPSSLGPCDQGGGWGGPDRARRWARAGRRWGSRPRIPKKRTTGDSGGSGIIDGRECRGPASESLLGDRLGAQLRRLGSPSVLLCGPGIPPKRGAAMFRVSHQGENIDDADTIDGARKIVRGPLRRGRDPGRAVPLGSRQPVMGPDAPSSRRAGRG
jgi:hypothetical protein